MYMKCKSCKNKLINKLKKDGMKNNEKSKRLESNYPTVEEVNSNNGPFSKNVYAKGLLGYGWKLSIPNDRKLYYSINYNNLTDTSYDGYEFITPKNGLKDDIINFFNDLSKIINIEFIESQAETLNDLYNEATLLISFSDDSKSDLDGSYGYAYLPLANQLNSPDLVGIVWINHGSKFKLEDWSPGSYNWITIVHEVGHALGLKHPHDSYSDYYPTFPEVSEYNPYADLGKNKENMHPLTVMGYTDLESPYVPKNKNGSGWCKGFGTIDIYVLQLLYGKSDKNTGDTIYTIPTLNDDSIFWEAIWDTDGNDTITGDNHTDALVIDLRSATIKNNKKFAGSKLTTSKKILNESQTGNKFFGFTIAKSVNIENAIGGNGNDKILGNKSNNQITSTAGNDLINGFKGYDTVIINDIFDNFIIRKKSKKLTVLKRRGKGGRRVKIKNCEKIIFTDREYII